MPDITRGGSRLRGDEGTIWTAGSGVFGAEAPNRAARAVGHDTAMPNGAGPAPARQASPRPMARRMRAAAVPALRARIPHARNCLWAPARRVETHRCDCGKSAFAAPRGLRRRRRGSLPSARNLRPQPRAVCEASRGRCCGFSRRSQGLGDRGGHLAGPRHSAVPDRRHPMPRIRCIKPRRWTLVSSVPCTRAEIRGNGRWRAGKRRITLP